MPRPSTSCCRCAGSSGRYARNRARSFASRTPRARESIILVGGLAIGANFNIVPDEFNFTVDRRPNADESYDDAEEASGHHRGSAPTPSPMPARVSRAPVWSPRCGPPSPGGRCRSSSPTGCARCDVASRLARSERRCWTVCRACRSPHRRRRRSGSARLRGLHPSAASSYAGYAYDCANLIALAAQLTGTDDASALRTRGRCDPQWRRLPVTSRPAGSSSSRAATSTSTARPGPIENDDGGDPTFGNFERFRFDATGAAMTLAPVPGASGCRSAAGEQVVQRRDHAGVERTELGVDGRRRGRSASCRRPP